MCSAMYMSALRTQIYLSPERRAPIDDYSRRTHKSMAEVIREALDTYLDGAAPDQRAALEQTFGALPDLTVPPQSGWAASGERWELRSHMP